MYLPAGVPICFLFQNDYFKFTNTITCEKSLSYIIKYFTFKLNYLDNVDGKCLNLNVYLITPQENKIKYLSTALMILVMMSQHK